jgi:hypothetical protein
MGRVPSMPGKAATLPCPESRPVPKIILGAPKSFGHDLPPDSFRRLNHPRSTLTN